MNRSGFSKLQQHLFRAKKICTLLNDLSFYIAAFHHPFNSTFPYDQTLNATLQQFCFHYAIPPDIIIKLFLPEFHAALWRICVFAVWVTMPEATVDENRRIVFTQKNIRMPRNRLICNPITIALCKKQFPQIHFGLCVF